MGDVRLGKRSVCSGDLCIVRIVDRKMNRSVGYLRVPLHCLALPLDMDSSRVGQDLDRANGKWKMAAVSISPRLTGTLHR